VLEVLKLDCTHDQAEELTIRADKFACDKDRPGSASPTEYRLAHERRSLRVGFERLEIVSVGRVELRDWPVTGKVDELPFRVNQPDNIDVRHALDLVLEQHMDVVTGHLSPIVLARRHAECLRSLDQTGLDNFERLERTIGLFSKNKGQVAQLSLIVGQNSIVETGNNEAGAGQDCAREQQTAENKQL